MRKFLCFFFVASFVVSCLDAPDCIEKRNNLVGITFKDFDSEETVELTIDTITARDAAVGFFSPAAASKVILPLNYFHDTTHFSISIADTIYTLTLAYDKRIEFIASDCGEKYHIDGLTVVAHDFADVQVTNGTPGVNSNAANIEIFK